MTDEEKALIDDLGNIWNRIIALPVQHPCDNRESERDIHDLQNRIMARAVMRQMGYDQIFKGDPQKE